MSAKKKRQPRYYAAVGRIPEDENYVGFGRSADKAIKDLRDDVYDGDEELAAENEKAYGQALIVDAVFSSKSPIKLEQI